MKTIKQLLTTIVVLLCSVMAHAYDFEVDGIYYNIISSSDLTAEVTEGDNEYSGEITIPSTVTYKSKTLKITRIARSAFSHAKIQSITIPNSIESIGTFAFKSCSNLTDVKIENGNTRLNIGIGFSDAYRDYGLFCDCPIKKLYLGRNMQGFDYYSYKYHNVGLFDNLNFIEGPNEPKSVTIGNNVTEIDFSIGYNIVNLYIENSETPLSLNTGIGTDTLYLGRNLNYENSPFKNSKLTTVTISENVTTIPHNAFSGCTNIKNINIPNSITTIEHGAFSKCTNLTNIIIPNSTTTIESSAFSNCTNLTNVIIGNSVSKIGSWAFNSCNFTNIILPNSLIDIGDNAFNECSNLINIIIPNNVTTIGDYAFEYCRNLKNVIIGDNVSKIGTRTFRECINLENITVGNLGIIKEKAFRYCANLTNIYLKDSTPPIVEDYNFTETQYANINLYIPPGTLSTYQTANIWKNFWNIQEKIGTYYKINYLVDGEFFATDSILCGNEIIFKDEPIKQNCTFSGWNKTHYIMPAENIIIEGTFIKNKYLLTFKIDNEIISSDSVEYGTKIIIPKNPTKEGYTFSGWSETPETMPANDITITGHFSINTYTITYMVDDEVFAIDSLTYGSEIVLRDEPTKEGYTFSGWSETPDSMPANDITITGSFSINTYAITYLIDDEVFAIDSLTYGSKIVLRDEPTKEGYTFSGWSEVPDSMPANDITITGSFSINTYAITYMVDDEVFTIDSLNFGTKIVLRDEPEKEGYTFSGWSEAPETMPANDITITGSFSINTYAITYLIDDEVFAIDSLTYGSKIVLRDEPEKEGYVFSGWSEAPETMPANDITITGSFDATAIQNVTIDATNIEIKDNSIILQNINNSTITIYTINGVLVKSIDNYAGEEIALDKGLYIVCIGNESIKIKI